FTAPPDPPALPSFPTRRSSDLLGGRRRPDHAGHRRLRPLGSVLLAVAPARLRPEPELRARPAPSRSTGGVPAGADAPGRGRRLRDRKSTRLNSSHDQISYAVFC